MKPIKILIHSVHDIVSFQISVHFLSGRQMKHLSLSKQTASQTHTLLEKTKQSLLRDGFCISSHCNPLALLEGRGQIWPGLYMGFKHSGV